MLNTLKEIKLGVYMEQTVDNRHLLIETAKDLFKKNGYEATSVSLIRGTAGLSNGTFYHYFKNKKELLAAICDQDADIYDLLSDIEDKAINPEIHLLEFYVSYAQYWNSLGSELAAEAYRLYDQIFLTKKFSKTAISVVKTVSVFVAAAQVKGCFDLSMSSYEATEYMFMMTRGILYEWILRHGEFDLVETSKKYLPRIIEPLVIKNSSRAL